MKNLSRNKNNANYMNIQTRYVIRRTTEEAPPKEFYEVVDVDYCCDKIEEEVEGRLGDMVDTDADNIQLIESIGSVGLTKTVRKDVPFNYCPFCGSEITSETTEAVERIAETVRVQKEETRVVQNEIEIPEEE